MADPYTTPLNKNQEIAYQLWRKRLPSDLQNETDYDLRGAFLNNAREAANGHLPDTFKKPNHITFSEESQYHSSENPGGQWVSDGNGSWVFFASPTNIKHNDPVTLQNYFNTKEKNSTLVLPDMGFDLSKVK